MDLREYLRDNVLEVGIANMILDNVMDMEEIVLKDIHIRKTHQQNYKFYKLNTQEEIFINTYTDYETEVMKNNQNCWQDFCKEFISLMRIQNKMDNDFVKDIIIQMIQYAFMRNKDSIVNYINQDDIKQT